MSFLNELKWRGMLQDSTPELAEHLSSDKRKAYIGFDPTAASMHIGNLSVIMILRLFQIHGHIPVALLGGATGMIGDPSGKSKERNLLDIETLRANEAALKKQFEKLLDFDVENAALMVNNFDWFSQIGFIAFIRDVGKHISVNYMMSKESVKNRLEKGISFTEFSYQLLQGYDFAHLYKEHEVSIQMGGSDQWGNITTGTELVRRLHGGSAFALTAPLITKADGSKFGKSEGGNIWLDPELTSPYKFYQFWINCSDDESKELIKKFTLLNEQEIEVLIAEHEEAPHQRKLQSVLAREVTTWVHSVEAYEQAKKASSILFGKSTSEDLESLDETTLLQVFEGVPKSKIDKDMLSKGKSLVDFAVEIGIFPSKGEAKRMIKSGAISCNKSKVTGEDFDLSSIVLLSEKYFLMQRGKKNYFLIEVV